MLSLVCGGEGVCLCDFCCILGDVCWLVVRQFVRVFASVLAVLSLILASVAVIVVVFVLRCSCVCRGGARNLSALCVFVHGLV